MFLEIKNQKRRFPRLHLASLGKTPCQNNTIRFQGFKDQKKIQGFLLSLSQSGLFIHSLQIMKQGTLLFLHFQFGRRRIQCLGRVIYTHPEMGNGKAPGFGVKFTHILRADHETIGQVIEEFHSGPMFEGLLRNLQ